MFPRQIASLGYPVITPSSGPNSSRQAAAEAKKREAKLVEALGIARHWVPSFVSSNKIKHGKSITIPYKWGKSTISGYTYCKITQLYIYYNRDCTLKGGWFNHHGYIHIIWIFINCGQRGVTPSNAPLGAVIDDYGYGCLVPKHWGTKSLGHLLVTLSHSLQPCGNTM